MRCTSASLGGEPPGAQESPLESGLAARTGGGTGLRYFSITGCVNAPLPAES